MTLSTIARTAVGHALESASAEASIALAQTTLEPEAAVLARIAAALDAYAVEVSGLTATDLGTPRDLRFTRPSRVLAGVLAAGALTPAASGLTTSTAFAAKQPVIQLPPNPGGESDDDPDVAPAGPAAETEPEPAPPAPPPPPPPTPSPPPVVASAPPAAPPAPPAPPEPTPTSPTEEPPPTVVLEPVPAPVPADPVPEATPVTTPEPAPLPPSPEPAAELPADEPTDLEPESEPSLEETDLDLPPVDLSTLQGSSGRPVTGHQPISRQSTAPPQTPVVTATRTSAPASTTRLTARLAPSAAYVVQPGDSLWSIAREHLPRHASETRIGLLAAELWAHNAERTATNDPDLLPVGTRLAIPTTTTEETS